MGGTAIFGEKRDLLKQLFSSRELISEVWRAIVILGELQIIPWGWQPKFNLNLVWISARPPWILSKQKCGIQVSLINRPADPGVQQWHSCLVPRQTSFLCCWGCKRQPCPLTFLFFACSNETPNRIHIQASRKPSVFLPLCGADGHHETCMLGLNGRVQIRIINEILIARCPAHPDVLHMLRSIRETWVMLGSSQCESSLPSNLFCIQ